MLEIGTNPAFIAAVFTAHLIGGTLAVIAGYHGLSRSPVHAGAYTMLPAMSIIGLEYWIGKNLIRNYVSSWPVLESAIVLSVAGTIIGVMIALLVFKPNPPQNLKQTNEIEAIK